MPGRLCRLVAGAVAALWTPIASIAAPIDLFDLSAPTFTSFSERDGLPGPVQTTVLVDRDGYVWSASPQGLARYDGRRWRRIDDAAVRGNVYDLMQDHAGVIWVALREQGLAHFDGTRWQHEGLASGLPTQQFRRVVETRAADGRYTLWALSLDHGLLRRERGHWVEDAGNAQLPAGWLLSFAQTSALGGAARQWVGTFNEGVWFRDEGGAWQPLRAEGFAPSQAEALLADGAGAGEALWMSTYGSGLWRLDAHGLKHWSREGGELPTNEVYDIARTPAPGGGSAIWLATRGGLARVYRDRVQAFDRRHGLPANAVRDVAAWRSPNGVDVLWLGTEEGVGRGLVGGSQWNTASLMGAGGNGVFGVYVEPDARGGERLWGSATADGVGLYEDGRWRRFSQAQGDLPDSDARMILRAPDLDGTPTLWLGQRSGYLLRWRGDRFETLDTPWERHSGQAVMDLLARRQDGAIEQWVATRQSGIYRHRAADGWTAFRADAAQGQWRVTQLREQVDAQGRSWLWAGTNQGLARFDGERWDLLGRDIGLPDVELIGVTLYPDAQGRPVLWIGSSHAGLVRVEVSDPRAPRVLPADLPPAPDPTVYSALRDSLGRMYLCSNNGVQQLTPDGRGGWRARVFGRHDGMLNDECNTNAQFVDAHDRYWTGTLGGLTVFDPAGERADHTPKPLRLTEVRLDGRALPFAPVRLPAGQHDLRIEFAALSWEHEEETRYRTQLQNYDLEPGDWTAQNYRDFNALPAGRYLLRVEARDYAGNLSAPATLAIERVPAWWERSAARALFGAAAILALYGLWRWRTHALRSQRGRLEEEVDQRTAELHDANARLLELSYRDALTGLANRRRLLQALEAEVPAEVVGPTALVFVDVDHFKDFNDHFGHQAGDEALCHVAAALQRCAPAEALVARYGGEEFACLLPGADVVQARALAEALRAEVAAQSVRLPGVEVPQTLTISAGVASLSLEAPADAQRLLRAADLALYAAKGAGRNCVRG